MRHHPAYMLALALADAVLAGPADTAAMARTMTDALGQSWPWVLPVCRRLRRRAGDDLHAYTRDEVADIICDHVGYDQAWSTPETVPRIHRYCLQAARPPEKTPWQAELAVPALATMGDLARWLCLPVAELAWYADQWRTNTPSTPQMRHYHYRWVPKQSGGVRLIEAPKLRLRAIQTRLLRRLLDQVAPHPAAHGFRRGHSCLTHASLHTGQAVLIRMDLKDFFPSIPASRVHALFAKLGYAHSVAAVLARLATHRTPSLAWSALPLATRPTPTTQSQLRERHLPQGAPSSPALANLCAFRLDIRLHALAQSLGARYSRYADDLAFSGPSAFARAAERFHVRVAAIALEEGFVLNTRKTRVMRAGVRQQLTGIVVNRHPNLARDEYDRLKAILTNCARHGPVSQNRDGRDNFRAHLEGKINYLAQLNPPRAAKLRRIFERIAWPDGEAQ